MAKAAKAKPSPLTGDCETSDMFGSDMVGVSGHIADCRPYVKGGLPSWAKPVRYGVTSGGRSEPAEMQIMRTR
ncbi:hypothetical protein GCM10016455_23270 [Aliiroseovarius zhejiangensis]|uniref:Uncharacterized protein n=1 Tax=Aliiroseovarius zhejiangensis TaxID=1632025 RepID=A0ABQ3J5L7_9RHOB|nr:hypothetical protein GCM10016455_23270 [Aliiroseovarius zhejiangensis]